MIAKYLAYLADFSILIPTLVSFFRYTNFKAHTEKLIALYGLLLLLRNFITLIMNQLGIYNIYIYNWHGLLGFIIITLIYIYAMKSEYFKYLAILCILFVLVETCIGNNTLFDVKTTNFNPFSYVYGCLAIIFILLYFYQLLQKLKVPNLTTDALFWFSAGAFFYYSGTIFSYLFIERTFNNSIQLRQQYWIIDALLSISFNIFLALSVFYMKSSRV